MNESFLKFLVDNAACQPALDWLATQKSPQSAWGKCRNGAWMGWYISLIGAWTSSLYAKYEADRAPMDAKYQADCAKLIRALFPKIPGWEGK